MRIQDKLRSSEILGAAYQSFINYYVAERQYLENRQELQKIKSFHNLHKGQRCFIIGTGPSLSATDLDKLKTEITFGSNRIFEIFSQTDWRPTYYVNQDFTLIDKYINEIKALEVRQKFLPIDKLSVFGAKQDQTYFVLRHKDFYPGYAEFSTNLNHYMGQGFTATYGAIQLAVYMGFTEIYLLGIDHNYSIYLDANGVPVMNEGVKDYFAGSTSSNKGLNLPRIEESTMAYITAKNVADRCKAFKVCNATRGGKLEVFDRVDFDSLFAGDVN